VFLHRAYIGDPLSGYAEHYEIISFDLLHHGLLSLHPIGSSERTTCAEAGNKRVGASGISHEY